MTKTVYWEECDYDEITEHLKIAYMKKGVKFYLDDEPELAELAINKQGEKT